MTLFKIEKDIPVPEYARWKYNAYPFPDMDVGDSFIVPLDMTKPIRNAAVKWRTRHPGWDFIVGWDRNAGSGHEIARLWRTK